MTAPTHIAVDRRNRILADLVATLADDIDQSKDASTTVASDSAAAQKVLNVASETSFTTGSTVLIGAGTAREERKIIASTGTGTITMTENLAYTHTAAQADTVWQGWYNHAMDRVETVDSPEDLGPPPGGEFPMCKVYAGQATTTGYLTGYVEKTMPVYVVAWMDVQDVNSTDQMPIESYGMLYADLERAINADWTLGGTCNICRIQSDVRVDDDTYPEKDDEDQRQDLPLVGVLLTLSVEYFEKFGDAYA